MRLREGAQNIRISEELKHYVVRLVAATRTAPGVQLGASPRASIALMKAAQALALFDGQEFVSPEHVHEIAAPVIAHRLVLEPQAKFSGHDLAPGGGGNPQTRARAGLSRLLLVMSAPPRVACKAGARLDGPGPTARPCRRRLFLSAISTATTALLPPSPIVFSRRVTVAGWVVLGGTVAAAASEPTPTHRAVIKPSAFLACLVLVAAACTPFGRPKFRCNASCPSSVGRRTAALSHRWCATKRRRRQSACALIEEFPDPRPDL